jgi:hypothetical protein
MMIRASEPPRNCRRFGSRDRPVVIGSDGLKLTWIPLDSTLGVSRLLRSAQIRMARAALNLTIRDLAQATVFHRNTLKNIEGRYAGNQDSIGLIENVFRKAGAEFLPQNGVRFHETPNTRHEGR